MKKLIMIIMSIACCLSFASCGGSSAQDGSNNGSPSVEDSTNSDSGEVSEDEQVTVTFKQDGKSDVVKTLKKGETLTEIPDPATKIGYTVEWEETDFTNITEDITVNAIETANTYTITYNANGGLLMETSQEVVFDANYMLSTPTHTVSYMRFDGWQDEDGNLIPLTGKWGIDNDTFLTAKWTDSRKTFTVSFVQAGQDVKVFEVKEGESLSQIPELVAKVGYTVEWEETDFTNITEDITVNAIETPKTYTITLQADGGTVAQTIITVVYGQAYKLPTPKHAYKGFICWTYNGEEIASEGTWEMDIDNGQLTLVAKWGNREWSENM